jgi:hypothetical protein
MCSGLQGLTLLMGFWVFFKCFFGYFLGVLGCFWSVFWVFFGCFLGVSWVVFLGGFWVFFACFGGGFGLFFGCFGFLVVFTSVSVDSFISSQQ